jgi:hypothetical protein
MLAWPLLPTRELQQAAAAAAAAAAAVTSALSLQTQIRLPLTRQTTLKEKLHSTYRSEILHPQATSSSFAWSKRHLSKLVGFLLSPHRLQGDPSCGVTCCDEGMLKSLPQYSLLD